MNKKDTLNEKINVGFLGYGTRALDALMEHPDFEVRHFICPEMNLCEDTREAEKKYGMPVVAVKDVKELEQVFAEISDVRCFVMNACSIILSQRAVDEMDVFNVHPGDLRTNRGHHPHLWTVLLGERSTIITLHKVNARIDLGEVIGEITVPITAEDDSFSVLNKAEDHLPELLDALRDHLIHGKPPLRCVSDGIYRKKLTYSDYTINPGNDGESDILRKIRARAMHNGAIVEVDNQRVYVDELLDYRKCSDGLPKKEINDGKLTVCDGGQNMEFKIRKIVPLKTDIQ